MDTKDKLTGIALILAGIAFIVLGFAFAMRGTAQPTTPVIPNVDAYVEPYTEVMDIEVIE